MRPPREDTVPWYKQFWPWFLISLPLSVVIASIVTINLAIESADGLVSDDYYKEGLAIHKNADSREKAKALRIASGLTYDMETGALAVLFDDPIPEAGAALVLTVAHPTLPDRDQAVHLTPLSDTAYAGRLEPLGAAKWRIELHPGDKSWRIEGRLTLPASPKTRLN